MTIGTISLRGHKVVELRAKMILLVLNRKRNISASEIIRNDERMDVVQMIL